MNREVEDSEWARRKGDDWVFGPYVASDDIDDWDIDTLQITLRRGEEETSVLLTAAFAHLGSDFADRRLGFELSDTVTKTLAAGNSYLHVRVEIDEVITTVLFRRLVILPRGVVTP